MTTARCTKNTIKRRRKLYEGKAKILYTTDEPKKLIQYFKDDATAFNGKKFDTITGKGAANCAIASALFIYLAKKGIPTHFIKKLSPHEQLIKKVDIVPLEVIIRNVAAGSFSRRYGVKEGTILKKPTFEFSYKKDELGDPLINRYHIIAMGLATEKQLNTIRELAFAVNSALQKFFTKVGVRLIDFKLEFGRIGSKIILADEISPDTCRFWDSKTGRKLDKDRFRFNLGGVEGAYTEMLKRISS